MNIIKRKRVIGKVGAVVVKPGDGLHRLNVWVCSVCAVNRIVEFCAKFLSASPALSLRCYRFPVSVSPLRLLYVKINIARISV